MHALTVLRRLVGSRRHREFTAMSADRGCGGGGGGGGGGSGGDYPGGVGIARSLLIVPGTAALLSPTFAAFLDPKQGVTIIHLFSPRLNLSIKLGTLRGIRLCKRSQA
jgi:hypothetical protein